MNIYIPFIGRVSLNKLILSYLGLWVAGSAVSSAVSSLNSKCDDFAVAKFSLPDCYLKENGNRNSLACQDTEYYHSISLPTYLYCAVKDNIDSSVSRQKAIDKLKKRNDDREAFFQNTQDEPLNPPLNIEDEPFYRARMGN